MRFGISATSSIFPKNLRTRLRPVNVCAIVASLTSPYARMDDGTFRRASTAPPGREKQGGGRNYFRLLRTDLAHVNAPHRGSGTLNALHTAKRPFRQIKTVQTI